MRRRRDDAPPTPPVELLSYIAWCERYGRRAYGKPSNPASMAEAVVSWREWESERDAWSAAHGGMYLDIRDDMPWDESAI